MQGIAIPAFVRQTLIKQSLNFATGKLTTNRVVMHWNGVLFHDHESMKAILKSQEILDRFEYITCETISCMFTVQLKDFEIP